MRNSEKVNGCRINQMELRFQAWLNLYVNETVPDNLRD